MSFIWPVMLWLLLSLPLFVALYARIQQRRRRLATNFGSLGIVQETSGRKPGVRRHIPAVIFLAGLALLMLAMARPQSTVNLPRIEGTVILAFDVSGSMAADDINPTRMEAAKSAAQAFIERQPPGVQIGVVSFSDSGFSIQPPTDDQNAILTAIGRLTPERGTSLGNGIRAALTTIAVSRGEASAVDTSQAPGPTPTPLPRGEYISAVIILLTDGENTVSPDPLEAAQNAVDRGVRVYTVGVGSPEGAVLEVEGFTVHTQLDEAMLEQIANITGGAYFSAQSEEELQDVYQDIELQLVVKPDKTEITSLFAGISILIFLIGGAFSLLWFSRVP